MLNQIKRPIEKEFKEFEFFFRKQMSSDIILLNIINNYIIRTKGKQLRPLIVFLTAGLNGGTNEACYIGAGMIELLHSASLIHDDVVDEAYERRGFFSINALWRSKVAVLVGDFMLSQGLNVAIKFNRIDMLKVMSEAVTAMSEGELLQIERSRKMNIDEETYYQIITKKTASLIAACCMNGAIAANASESNIQAMKNFGTNLGIAFQIRDDLFDYQPSGLIGKPTGNDIKEKKLTLPLIYALKVANKSESKHIKQLIQKADKRSNIVDIVSEFVKKYSGIEYTIQKMYEFRNNAKAELTNFPESDYRKSLELLCDFIVERKK